ncbi:MAG: peptidoglycan DD-metalloendopeptidase family protein [Ilumatobacteraceae bacterium]
MARRTTALATWVALSASLVGSAPGIASAGPAQRAVAMPAACAKTYDVVSGDYWIKIASKAGVTTSALYQVNGANANTPLYPGMQVCLPDTATVPATTAPATTPPPPAAPGTVQLAAFPAQGPCSYTDTFQAPRGGGRVHEGVDLIAKTGQYVYAVVNGRLSKQAVDKPGSLSGNAWWLTGDDGSYYFYAHLSAFAPGLKIGAKVQAGQIIGFIGSTGNAGVSHLHFEVHPKGGVAANPTPIVRAIDGCSTSAVPPQPGGEPPAPPTNTAPAVTAPPSTSPPATTAPPAAPVVLPPSAPVSTQPGSLWQFITPVTVFDSAASGALAGGATRTIRVNHAYGVPAGTAGVIVRLSASQPASAGYLVTHPCDFAPPVASTLSVNPGRTSVGSATIRVVGGNVCVTASTAVRLKVEVLGAQAASGVGLQPVSAARAVDTRETTRLVPGAALSLSPASLGATPGTQALSASVTIVNPAAAGTLAMGFCGQGGWRVPFSSDPVSSFAITMRVNNAGWCLTTSVATDVIVDVVGNWTTDATLMGVVDPVRVYDSRLAGGPIGIGAVGVPVAGLGGVPADASIAMLSVTTVTGGIGSSVFLVPCGEGRSAGTVIASSAYRISTAVVPVKLGGGAACISSFNAIDVIIDVVGAG